MEDSHITKNPYRSKVQANNLLAYLRYMADTQVTTLFVGEAPGYLGCAMTGIPFTDEYRLTPEGNVGCTPLLAPGYYLPEESMSSPHREMSAGIMWTSFVENNFFPMMWNAFPLHPHKPYNPLSNRTPTQREIQTNMHVLSNLLLALPSIQHIYAVGRKAETMLAQMNILSAYIRHPSHGGASECRARICEIALFHK